MPTDAREQAFAALYGVLGGISSIGSRTRDLAIPADFTDPAITSWLAQMDGEEDPAEVELTGRRRFKARAEVWLAVRAASGAAAATALNALRSVVLTALYADHTLGGVVEWVSYEGCTAPALEYDGIGAMTLVLLLHRTESETNPYSLG